MSFASVSAGYSHTCAVTSTGAVYCWGDNGSGQLGPGATGATSTTPALVQGLGNDADGVIAVVAAGALSVLGVRTGHSCALLGNGHVWCWGSNVYGELGDGQAASSSTPVESGVTDAIAIAAASDFTCAMLASGHVSCWGANTSGELGDDSTVSSRSPVLVFGL
jgi:alpha-tubulin suppressor-like RCC1 family protein